MGSANNKYTVITIKRFYRYNDYGKHGQIDKVIFRNGLGNKEVFTFDDVKELVERGDMQITNWELQGNDLVPKNRMNAVEVDDNIEYVKPSDNCNAKEVYDKGITLVFDDKSRDCGLTASRIKELTDSDIIGNIKYLVDTDEYDEYTEYGINSEGYLVVSSKVESDLEIMQKGYTYLKNSIKLKRLVGGVLNKNSYNKFLGIDGLNIEILNTDYNIDRLLNSGNRLTAINKNIILSLALSILTNGMLIDFTLSDTKIESEVNRLLNEEARGERNDYRLGLISALAVERVIKFKDKDGKIIPASKFAIAVKNSVDNVNLENVIYSLDMTKIGKYEACVLSEKLHYKIENLLASDIKDLLRNSDDIGKIKGLYIYIKTLLGEKMRISKEIVENVYYFKKLSKRL